MNQPTYDFQHSPFDETYTFISEGKHGAILKMVRFREIEENIFNLGFGDYIASNQQIDDSIVSDNGDMIKILATVIKISENFFIDNQDVSIFITGSTPSRTRLYQIAISTNLPLLSMTYEIYGFRDSSWEIFQKNATYEAFLVQKLF